MAVAPNDNEMRISESVVEALKEFYKVVQENLDRHRGARDRTQSSMDNFESIVAAQGEFIKKLQEKLDQLRGAGDRSCTQCKSRMDIFVRVFAALRECIKQLQELFDQLRGNGIPTQYKTRIENLESIVVAQGELVKKLQEKFDRLRRARERTRTQFSVDMNLTGEISEDSFTKMLDEVSSEGDLNFSAILEVLRREAFGSISLWRPIKPEIKRKKKEIVRWMLCARNVHKFSSDQVIFNVGNCSVWTNLVEEIFAEQDRKKKVTLVNYFRAAARSHSPFGGFVKSLVRTHSERCQSCVSP